MKKLKFLLLTGGLVWLAGLNNTAMACAACYGQSDSPMARGMNAGIFTLLGVIGAVLCGAGTFFVFLARRASATSKAEENPKN